MTLHSDIQANLDVASDLLQRIETSYKASLKQQAIDPRLSVLIKNYLENLRPPLDYIAVEICTSTLSLSRSHRTYFPIACENDKAYQSFIAKHLPGLDSADQSLFNIIKDIQAYKSNGCKALPRLSKLVNENKHRMLSPQTRRESRELEIKFPGGGSIKMGPGASISGSGTISSGGGVVHIGGGTVSGNSPARTSQNVQQVVTVWVSFHFTESGEEILSLLRACRNDVDRVVSQLLPLV